MEILISDTSKTKLHTGSPQPFLIINLIGCFFLLVKANSKSSFDKNIIFETETKEFYSTFIRHVNLSYSGKLSQLIQQMNIMSKPALQHQWIMLYQIHNFVPNQTKYFKIQPPSYGAQVIVQSRDHKRKKDIISNLFRLHGQSFYFLSCSISSIQQFSIVTDETGKIIYGLTYFIKQVTVCIPFHSICSEKPCPMNIFLKLKQILEGTCYIRQGSSYCTGFVSNNGQIISARHVIPFDQQKIGLEVGVRLYPFNEEKVGHVSRIGEGGVDILQITLASPLVVKTPTATTQRSNEYRLKIEQQYLLGKQIMAIGFGKYGYSPKIFTRIDVVMPTIQKGIISKVIQLRKQNVFLKTDAALYNGFSGCGIWLDSVLIGMAIFILKNKNNSSNFNRHNFSYTSDFIFKILGKNSNQFLISEMNQQLCQFDKIRTRHWIPILPRL